MLFVSASSLNDPDSLDSNSDNSHENDSVFCGNLYINKEGLCLDLKSRLSDNPEVCLNSYLDGDFDLWLNLDLQ